MYGLGHDKDIDRASHIFQWVDKKGSRGEDYRAFIFANAKVGNWRDARYYYETYKKTRPGEPPNDADLRLMTTLLAAYARGRNSGGAEVLYDEICRKYRPSDTLTTTLITSYANGSIRGFNKARVLFMKSFDLTFTPSANAWMKVMLNLYASLSAVAGERQDEVEKKLEPAKVFTYADSITRLAAMKARYLEDRFWRLYEIMRRFPTHYKPDAITYFHCLQFARASRRPERAIEVLRAAGEDGIKHTAYYNLVLGAHSKVLDSASTYQYFREMRAEYAPSPPLT
ncbi:hypothetical protein DIPPA_13913 [Diplonema papillatum]|nr:hypothetical protein DIPPA_13913 [Diplonema papillatum]